MFLSIEHFVYNEEELKDVKTSSYFNMSHVVEIRFNNGDEGKLIVDKGNETKVIRLTPKGAKTVKNFLERKTRNENNEI